MLLFLSSFPDLLSGRQQVDWLKTYDDMNAFTDNWLGFASQVLQATALL